MYGFVRIAAAVPTVRVANAGENARRVVELMDKAVSAGARVVCFPELCLTGYTCADLFFSETVLRSAELALDNVVAATRDKDITVIVGLPLRHGDKLYNVAAVCRRGQVNGFVPKTHLPNYNEFYERRWFVSGASLATGVTRRWHDEDVPFAPSLLFDAGDFTFSVEICEDLWAPIPPSSKQALAGSHVIFNLSASDELLGKHDYLLSLVRQQSARCIAAYVYAGAGYGESSTDTLFAGNAMVAENGTLIATSERFKPETQLVVTDVDVERLRSDRQRNTTFAGECSTAPVVTFEGVSADEATPLLRAINPHPFLPSDDADRDSRCSEIFNIQAESLAVRMRNVGIRQLVVGVSGGLDSTLALLVSARAMDILGIDRKNVLAITMPGFGTTCRTRSNAKTLIEALGCRFEEISIAAAVGQHFKDIGQDPANHDVTYENAQARERTQVLMDKANQTGGLVVGTGDLSELALGWATYNGDQMSMYGVNAGVPKTLVRHLVQWVADHHAELSEVLNDIIATPVSPELLPADDHGDIAQKTEDLVGPYELHDFFIYYTLRFGFSPRKIQYLAEQAFIVQAENPRYDKETIEKWLKTFFRRFFHQQFKRSAMPDGPKVGSVSLSPRGDWRMPSDADVTEFLES